MYLTQVFSTEIGFRLRWILLSWKNGRGLSAAKINFAFKNNLKSLNVIEEFSFSGTLTPLTGKLSDN